VIGALVAILSLNLTQSLIDSGVVHKTLTVTDVSQTTPIVVTVDPPHGFANGRTIHGVIDGVTGATEANGAWVMTPNGKSQLILTTFSEQGIPANSVGVNAYVDGGTLQYAFPDGCILLGRRNVALASAVATPRIVFVPTVGRAWGFDPDGGQGSAPMQDRGSLEQQSERLQPQLETEYTTFEVFVTGSAPDYGAAGPAPDFADFDATQALVHALYAEIFDAVSQARGRVLRESWPSQAIDAGTMLQRGQQCCVVIEFQQPVTKAALQFVPIGTSLEITVGPVNAAQGDETVIVVNP
jgi:hypothetical protein